jgi:predicted ATP-dependent serine protease
VPKNRFGPEQLKGLPLVIDPVTTVLRLSPHREPVTGICRTFLGTGFGAGEMQAMVSLPSHNAKPQIQAPGLPRRRIEQLLSCIARVPGLEMDDLDLSIGCLMPGDVYFRSVFGLPLSLALIGSFLRRAVPAEVLAIGEIDLNRAVRPLSDSMVNELTTSVPTGELGVPLRLLCPPSAATFLPSGAKVEVLPCPTLDAAIRATWPQVE